MPDTTSFGPLVHFEEIVLGILGEYAAAVAEAVQVPFELPLINALGAVAAVAQRKFCVQMHEGYTEPLNSFALAVLPPGERKSAVKDACRFPLLEWEQRQQQLTAAALTQAQAERQVQEEMQRVLLTSAKKCQSKDDRQALAAKITQLKNEVPRLTAAPRLLADDATPEALAALMAQQGHRIAMLEAEGRFFDTLSGRYSNGVPNLDAVLKAWSGEAVRIDRRHADPILLATTEDAMRQRSEKLCQTLDTSLTAVEERSRLLNRSAWKVFVFHLLGTSAVLLGLALGTWGMAHWWKQEVKQLQEQVRQLTARQQYLVEDLELLEKKT